MHAAAYSLLSSSVQYRLVGVRFSRGRLAFGFRGRV